MSDKKDVCICRDFPWSKSLLCPFHFPTEPKPAVVLPELDCTEEEENNAVVDTDEIGHNVIELRRALYATGAAYQCRNRQLLQSQTELAEAKEDLRQLNEDFTIGMEKLTVTETELTELRAAVVVLANVALHSNSDSAYTAEMKKAALRLPIVQRTLAAAEGKGK